MTIVTDRSMSRPSGAPLPNRMRMTSGGGRRSVAGDVGKRAMKTVLLGAAVAITATLAHAEDMAETISRYRHAHGLSADKTDPQLTAIAARISGAHTDMAAENIAAGTRTWAETFHMWQTSSGHNANLLQSKADIVGVAVAHNEQTRYKTYWAMVIAAKPSKKKEPKVAAQRKTPERQAIAW